MINANYNLDNKINKTTKQNDYKKTSQEFAQIFINHHLGEIYKSRADNPILGGGYGEKVMHKLLVDEYAKVMSQEGNLGMSEMIYKNMLKMR